MKSAAWLRRWRRRKPPSPQQGFVSDGEAALFWTPPADRTVGAVIRSSGGDFSGPPVVGDDFWYRTRSWLRPVVGTLHEAIETDSGGIYLAFEVTPEDNAYLHEHIESAGDDA